MAQGAFFAYPNDSLDSRHIASPGKSTSLASPFIDSVSVAGYWPVAISRIHGIGSSGKSGFLNVGWKWPQVQTLLA